MHIPNCTPKYSYFNNRPRLHCGLAPWVCKIPQDLKGIPIHLLFKNVKYLHGIYGNSTIIDEYSTNFIGSENDSIQDKIGFSLNNI